jgi:predicted CoA-binding protein
MWRQPAPCSWTVTRSQVKPGWKTQSFSTTFDSKMADNSKAQRVVVLGASPKPERYAYKAMQMLRKYGHEAIPVNPGYPEILGTKCYSRINQVPAPVDTVTVYLGKRRSDRLIDHITNASPRRIILNPGAENDELSRAARGCGIEVVEGCTLVMLSIGTF